tara:strand:+ start:237 stop:2144 length:1908 start_codon:yes stop_codon:yes gene_type:complete
MSTQIFTSPQDNCKVDHIKVATLASSFNTADGTGDYDDSWAFIGGNYSWMSNPTTQYTTALGGNILNVSTSDAAMAIILPVDVDENDVITLQGVANSNTGLGDINCQFLIGVSYVSCNDFATNDIVNVFTLIPAELFPNAPERTFTVCFNLETTNVTLPAGTLLFVGVNCPTFNDVPAPCNFSYTLDITKSCAPIIIPPQEANVRIQNCCEQAVFEVISGSTLNLPDSGTFSDTEGNCWTIIEITPDPIDTIRFVSSQYVNCNECLIDNPCPANLSVVSCCAGQQEFFTGSLPGINVGDTFIDTYGFCWNVTEETSGPITGLVIVDSVSENCETCITTPGACPDVYIIFTCCDARVTLVTTLDLLGSGVAPEDTFMDQFGNCWTISPQSYTGPTVNGAFIQAVTNYGPNACETCLLDLDNCGNPVIYKVQNCCSGAIEYVETQFGFSIEAPISFTTTATPTISQCYKVIDWDNTTTPTITIDTFTGQYKNCKDCTRKNGCPNFYMAYSCDGIEEAVFYGVYPNELPSQYYTFITNDGNCWYSSGMLTSGPATITVSQQTSNCEQCLVSGFYTVVGCEDGPILPNEVIFLSGMPTFSSIKDDDTGYCYSITSPTIGPATIQSFTSYNNCIACINPS